MLCIFVQRRLNHSHYVARTLTHYRTKKGEHDNFVMINEENWSNFFISQTSNDAHALEYGKPFLVNEGWFYMDIRYK